MTTTGDDTMEDVQSVSQKMYRVELFQSPHAWYSIIVGPGISHGPLVSSDPRLLTMLDRAYEAGRKQGHDDGIATEKARNIADKIKREWDAMFHESPTPANDINKPESSVQVGQVPPPNKEWSSSVKGNVATIPSSAMKFDKAVWSPKAPHGKKWTLLCIGGNAVVVTDDSITIPTGWSISFGNNSFTTTPPKATT